MTNSIKITFEPGCFDSFTGTQEEIDELIHQIRDTIEGALLGDLSTLAIDTEPLNPDLVGIVDEFPDQSVESATYYNSKTLH